MIRQNIILGGYTYIADYYKADVDKDYIPVYKKFVMIKNSNIMNNVIYDTDVYFIEEDIIDACVNEDGTVDTSKLSDYIAYPVNSKLSGYSTNYKSFNDNFSKDSFIYGNDIQRLYNSKYEETSIKCDLVRIYLPTLYAKLNAIVCIKSYINNIQFYFVCRPASQYSLQSETEFTVDHVNYSEYFNVYIPSISTLFAHNSIYAIENSSLNEIKQQFNYTIDDNSSASVFVSLMPVVNSISSTQYTVENKLKFSINTFAMSNIEFRLYSTSNAFDKTYNSDFTTIRVPKEELSKKGVTYDEFIQSIKDANENADITIYKSEYKYTYDLSVTAIYDASLGEYTIDLGEYADIIEVRTPNNAFLRYETSTLVDVNNFEDLYIEAYDTTNSINVSWSKFSNKINIMELQTMTMPFAIMPVTDFDDVSYKKVYMDVTQSFENNYENSNLVVILYPYSSINNGLYEMTENAEVNSDVFTSPLNFGIHSCFAFSEDKSSKGELMVHSVFDYPKSFSTVWDAYCYYNNVTNKDYYNWKPEDNDIDEDFYNETNITKVGYRIEIATDKFFKNIIYTYDVNINLDDTANFISDFDFSIDGIFAGWDEKPELLVIHTMFIDKVLANVFTGNDIILHKDAYKYIISDSKDFEKRVIALPDMQADPTLIKTQEDTMDLTKFNFIDKISCTVNKTETTNTVGGTNNTPKILYKPIFYKVADLQTLKIREGVTQNIGVNLADLMTKVDTFKLVIDGEQYVETARNDVYVIFTINSTLLSNANGIYSITNQDDEFISSGSWYLY